jgi:hypothetical protein
VEVISYLSHHTSLTVLLILAAVLGLWLRNWYSGKR